MTSRLSLWRNSSGFIRVSFQKIPPSLAQASGRQFGPRAALVPALSPDLAAGDARVPQGGGVEVEVPGSSGEQLLDGVVGLYRGDHPPGAAAGAPQLHVGVFGSEERRVGKECRSRWSPYH